MGLVCGMNSKSNATHKLSFAKNQPNYSTLSLNKEVIFIEKCWVLQA